MTHHRTRNLIVAAALACVSGVLTMVYVGTARAKARSGEAMTTVYVAKKDIAAGTTGEQALARELLEARRVPRASVAPGAVDAPSQVRGLIAVQPVFAGDQITARRFAAVERQGVLANLKGRMRAIQVPGDRNQLLAGILKDGNRVDVLAAVKPTPHAQTAVSRIVLRNVVVLRAPEEDGDDGFAGDTPRLSATLQLTDRQAQDLFYVLKNGEWSLVLRPVLRPQDSPDATVSATSVLGSAS